MECIICHDSGAEPLQDNTVCSCKYKRHVSCWIDYVHSTTVVKCPTCRKDLTVKKDTSKVKSIPQSIVVTQSSNQYQELVETTERTQSPRNSVITLARPPECKDKVQKILSKLVKITVAIGIVAIVMTIVLVIL